MYSPGTSDWSRRARDVTILYAPNAACAAGTFYSEKLYDLFTYIPFIHNLTFKEIEKNNMFKTAKYFLNVFNYEIWERDITQHYSYLSLYYEAVLCFTHISYFQTIPNLMSDKWRSIIKYSRWKYIVVQTLLWASCKWELSPVIRKIEICSDSEKITKFMLAHIIFAFTQLFFSCLYAKILLKSL